MRRKLIPLFLFAISGNVMASQTYDLAATVKHNDKTLSSSQLKLAEGDRGQIQNDNCTYSSRISEQSDNTLLVESDISCGDFVFQPVFVLSPDGGKAKLETGGKGDVWEFAINVLVQH